MKILIIDEMHLSIIDLLEKEGHQVDYEPKISRSEILEKVAGYHGLVIRSKTSMDRELLEKASQLQFIARAGAGLDQIDLELFLELNLCV